MELLCRGQKYAMEWIQAQDATSQQQLKRLRSDKERGNDRCADCGQQDLRELQTILGYQRSAHLSVY
eukprot:6470743-Amphidinium_carterae.1